MGSDSSEGLELRSTHFYRRTKDPKTPTPIGPTGIKIPSKTTKRLNNHPLRSLNKDRSTSKTHPFEGLQTNSKFEILTTILDNTKLLSLKSYKTIQISCVIAKELIADYET